jgi:hypothetical protein
LLPPPNRGLNRPSSWMNLKSNSRSTGNAKSTSSIANTKPTASPTPKAKSTSTSPSNTVRAPSDDSGAKRGRFHLRRLLLRTVRALRLDPCSFHGRMCQPVQQGIAQLYPFSLFLAPQPCRHRAQEERCIRLRLVLQGSPRRGPILPLLRFYPPE